MEPLSFRPPQASDASPADETTAPRLDRYAVALNVFVLICATLGVYLSLQFNHHDFWQILSLLCQTALAAISLYRLSRMNWKRDNFR